MTSKMNKTEHKLNEKGIFADEEKKCKLNVEKSK